MDKFDEIVKNAVEGYEAPYNAQAWANVSSQLGPKSGPMNWIIGTAAAATLIVGAVYFMQDDEVTATNDVVPNEIVSVNNNSINNTTTVNENNTAVESVVNNNNGQNTVDPIEDKANGIVNSTGTTHTTTTNSNGATTTNGGTTINGGTTVNNGTTSSNGGSLNNNGGTPDDHTSSARLNARFYPNTTTACANEKFVFTPEDQNQKVEYTWSFGDGTESIDKVCEHTFKKSGNYTVTLTVKDAKTGKSVQHSIEVVANPLPVSQFAWTKSNDAIPTVNFSNTTEDAVKGTWNIQGLKSTSDSQFEYTFRNRGTYMVKLTTENEFGCQHAIQKPIVIENDYNLLAPTAFAPNGDGTYDNFIPQALLLMDVDFTMMVYDKNGLLMYQTNNAYMPWDGTNVNDNTPAANGAYVWMVQYKNANGEMEMYQGQVIITR